MPHGALLSYGARPRGAATADEDSETKLDASGLLDTCYLVMKVGIEPTKTNKLHK